MNLPKSVELSILKLKNFGYYILLTKDVSELQAEAIQSIEINRQKYILVFTAPDRIPAFAKDDSTFNTFPQFGPLLFNKKYLKGNHLLFQLGKH